MIALGSLNVFSSSGNNDYSTLPDLEPGSVISHSDNSLSNEYNEAVKRVNEYVAKVESDKYNAYVNMELYGKFFNRQYKYYAYRLICYLYFHNRRFHVWIRSSCF